jgi:protocatechuate 3,4-dioxygenase beta subunit
MSRMPHDHDRGLDYDLPRLINRRRALSVLTGGAAAAFLAACGESRTTGSTSTATSTSEIPDETAGPYPGDGSNGPNALADSGVVRTDITSSFGDATGEADGVPTTIEMTLLDVAGGGGPLAGAAVYLWHCTADGQYSMYDPQVASENFLRGVQESGKDGKVTFTSIFPGAYWGRWPHIHFEVYESLDAATRAGTKLKTSQIAIPQDGCDAAYATDRYAQSVQNLASTSLDGDMVFSDGYASQLATAAGTPDSGITLKLNVGI